MTKEMLEEIKGFAEYNFCSDNAIYADDDEFAVTNPWMDHSGRFVLTDEAAVKEWGLCTVMQFCEKVQEEMKKSSLENGKVEITYEITKRYCGEYEVTKQEYDDICKGQLSQRLINKLDMCAETNGEESSNWTATNVKTGKLLQDWEDK